MSDPLIGRVLSGRYRVQVQLGSGGVARVYKANQEPMDRQVAVKVVRPDLDPQQREAFERRFLREAALAGRLSHPGVVTVHDYGRADDGTCFIVMELLQGRSLRARMDGRPMPQHEVARIGAKLARGLRHAHKKGLVHRDVKPGNIFLVQDDEGIEQPKLLDFGLVKEDSQSTITDAGTFLGTPHYVSPEQAKGLDVVDHRADLYSLGAVLWRMLAGRLLFEASNPMAIALKHLREPVPWIETIAPEVRVHADLEQIIRRCLCKDADDRWDDAGDLARALESWLAANPPEPLDDTVITETLAAGPTLQPDPEDTAPPKRRRGMGLMVGGAVGLLLCGGGVGAGLWWLERQPPVISSPAEDVVGPLFPEPAVVDVAPEPVVQPDPEPVVAPDPEPVAEPDPEPVVEPDPEPVAALDPEPVAAPDPEPVAEPDPEPVPEPEPDPEPVAEPDPEPAPSVDLDGVVMTAAQAQRMVQWVNDAGEADLYRSEIYSGGIKVILENRPFSSPQAFAKTPYVGPATIEAALAASQN